VGIYSLLFHVPLYACSTTKGVRLLETMTQLPTRPTQYLHALLYTEAPCW